MVQLETTPGEHKGASVKNERAMERWWVSFMTSRAGGNAHNCARGFPAVPLGLT